MKITEFKCKPYLPTGIFFVGTKEEYGDWVFAKFKIEWITKTASGSSEILYEDDGMPVPVIGTGTMCRGFVLPY